MKDKTNGPDSAGRYINEYRRKLHEEAKEEKRSERLPMSQEAFTEQVNRRGSPSVSATNKNGKP
jgi:hypothetical protein